jgi:hypothetical protein
MIKWDNYDDVEWTLNIALRGKICVQVWLGYAMVLFVGFGNEVLSSVKKYEMHPKPPYEIQIDSSDWWIQQGSDILTKSTDERDKVEPVIAKLVGLKVINWSFDNPKPALRIEFENGLELRMTPYKEGKPSDSSWILRDLVHYGSMDWNETISNGRLDHWFIDDKGPMEFDEKLREIQ